MSTLKGLREHLCQAQAEADWPGDVELLVGETIRAIDRHRPLGPDMKHDERHTPTCGCDDK